MTVITPADRDEWGKLTDRFTADHQGYDVTIELLDPERGDDSLVERLPFRSLTYDHKDDVAVVAVGGTSPRYPVVLRHLIHHPRELSFDLIAQGAAVKIIDDSGTSTLVSLLRRKGDGGPAS